MRMRSFVLSACVAAVLLTGCAPPSAGVDCSARGPGVDLHGCDLSGADLSWLDLTGANLTGANLTDANLAGTILAGANLNLAVLVRGRLYDPRPDLEFHEMAPTVLSHATLVGADLSDADLQSTQLDGADAAFARFTRAFVARSNLSGADLTGADFQGAYLWDIFGSGTNFTLANFGGITDPTQDLSFPGATWFLTTCPDGSISNEPCAFPTI